MIKNLRESLVDYDLSLLRAVAEARGFELVAGKPPGAMDELLPLLLAPESVTWALEIMSARAREALDALLAGGGRMKAHVFASRFGEIRTFGPGRLERERPWRQPESAAEELWFLGLVFRAIANVGHGYRAQFVYIPSDMTPLLPKPPGRPPEFGLQTAVGPVTPDRPAAPLTEAIFGFLSGVQRRKIAFDAAGNLTVEAHEYLSVVQRALHSESAAEEGAASQIRLEFAAHLVRAAGLIFPSPGRPRLSWGRASRWLKAPRRRQTVLLYQAWREDTGWNELCHIPGLKCEETGWRNDPFLSRQALLEFLARCPFGDWLRLDSFVSQVYDVDPDFARPDGDYRSWYIRDTVTGEFLMGFDSWPRVEGALIRSYIEGPLSWLGVVETGREVVEAGGPVFRISSLGQTLLARSIPADRAEDPPARLDVRPDFTVLIPFDGRLYDRFQLGRFARLKETVAGEGLIYAISRSSLSAAHAQSITLQMILRFLVDRTPRGLPRNVLSALRRWRPAG